MLTNNKEFYESYFDQATYDIFKYDVGGFCTKRAILSEVNYSQGNVLEVGIGIASLLEGLQHLSCYGIDISEKTVSRVKQRFESLKLRGELQVADAINIPFDDNFFDVIVSAHVFEHIKDDAKAFQECFRVLKPQGSMVLFVPGSLDGKAPLGEWERCGHYRNYNSNEFLRLEHATRGKLKLQKILYVHKVHNLIWNKVKHFMRWCNYPVKKWILKDNHSYESRKFYQSYLLPSIAKTLDFLDKPLQYQEKYLFGTKFNVLAVFKKL